MKGFRNHEEPGIQPYIVELGHFQAELREHYLAGEISYADLKGMESRELVRLAWRTLAINVDKDVEEDSPSTPPPAEDDSCHFLA